MGKQAWTHKVVKSARGGQGEWFDFRGVVFGSEAEAREYASRFATEQRSAGVLGARIAVRERKGNRTVAAHNVNRGDVVDYLRNADLDYTEEV